MKLLRSRSSQGMALLALSLATALLLLLTIQSTPAPAIDLKYADTTIRVAADRAWTLFPGDCLNLSWEMEGIQSLYINDYGRIGNDKMRFCPALNATNPIIEVTAQNGIYRRLELEIQHLPDLIIYLFGFVGVLGSGLLSLYFLINFRPDRPLPINSFLIALLILLVLGGAIRLSPAQQPLLDEDNGSVAVRFWAERGDILFPHECIDVGWSVAGAQALRFNGADASAQGNPGRSRHCAEAGSTATLEVSDESGALMTATLTISSALPALAAAPAFSYLAAFGILLGAAVNIPISFGWRANRGHVLRAAIWWRSAPASPLSLSCICPSVSTAPAIGRSGSSTVMPRAARSAFTAPRRSRASSLPSRIHWPIS